MSSFRPLLRLTMTFDGVIREGMRSEWDPEILARLRSSREETSLRLKERTISNRAASQPHLPEIKMVVGDWCTDELGNRSRMIYNAKTVNSKAGLVCRARVCRPDNCKAGVSGRELLRQREDAVRATRASLSCSRTALTDAPPTSTIFLSLAATRSSLRARSRHGLRRPSVLRSHCRPDQRHRFPSPSGDSVCCRTRWGCLGSDVRAAAVLIGSVFVLAACSQAIDYTYSRKNFSSSTFEADLSACKRQGPSISASRRPRKRNAHNWTMRQCGMS